MRYTELVAVLTICLAMGCDRNNNPVVNSDNAPPVIQAVTFIPDTLIAGASCVVQCVAVDQDNDVLSYIWNATGNISSSGATVFFSPSACCAFPKVEITVKDGHGNQKDTVVFIPIKY